MPTPLPRRPDLIAHRPIPATPEQQQELQAELARLREEIAQTRNVVIKADNLIKNVNAEVRTVTLRQGKQERKTFFNSAVSYLIFVILIFGGLYMTFQSRLRGYDARERLAQEKAEGQRRENAQLNTELERWRQTERALLEFEQLVREGEKERAVEKFNSLKRLKFSGLLERIVIQFKSEVAEELYEQGVNTYERDAATAKGLFLRSLEYNPEPPYIGQLYYYQGMTALRLEDYQAATEFFRSALDYKHSRKHKANLEYYLAFAHERLGDKRTARTLYCRFSIRYQQRERHRAATAKRRCEYLKQR
ncbi:MAG: hypothetical protein VYD19_10420 [Myxococcota bacterium]|nr:hypothetical protein [Myxococcota bacterium]